MSSSLHFVPRLKPLMAFDKKLGLVFHGPRDIGRPLRAVRIYITSKANLDSRGRNGDVLASLLSVKFISSL
jgi:hypothetical protein